MGRVLELNHGAPMRSNLRTKSMVIAPHVLGHDDRQSAIRRQSAVLTAVRQSKLRLCTGKIFSATDSTPAAPISGPFDRGLGKMRWIFWASTAVLVGVVSTGLSRNAGTKLVRYELSEARQRPMYQSSGDFVFESICWSGCPTLRLRWGRIQEGAGLRLRWGIEGARVSHHRKRAQSNRS